MAKQSSALLVACALVAVILAGCASDEGTDVGAQSPGAPVDSGSFQLQAGRGAVAGLLVDDRFRPIHLVENPNGEFQATGFVLLQETGEQAMTNENGEFTFVNLEPGQYTLRVTAAGHEATPQRVTVAEGIFNEASVIARRTASEGSFILTQEQSMFTECTLETPVVSSAWLPCTLDLSLDGARTDFRSNFSAFGDDVTAMITEATFNHRGYYDIAVRRLHPDTGGIGATYYSECSVNDGQYLKIIMFPGEVNDCGNRNVEFDLSQEFQTIMFAWSDTHGIAQDTTGTNGVGTKLAVQAKVIQSVFLGPPEVDLESYCVLC